MTSIDELVENLKTLTPEQLDQVARIVRGLSASGTPQKRSFKRIEIPQSIIDEAVRHNWPQDLFTELIGSLPELERAAQPSYDVREAS